MPYFLGGWTLKGNDSTGMGRWVISKVARNKVLGSALTQPDFCSAVPGTNAFRTQVSFAAPQTVSLPFYLQWESRVRLFKWGIDFRSCLFIRSYLVCFSGVMLKSTVVFG